MANIQVVSFGGTFISDGSNILILDLSAGPVGFNLSLVPDAKLASNVSSLFAGGGVISSFVLNKGILTINYSTPPLLGQQSFSGFLQF